MTRLGRILVTTAYCLTAMFVFALLPVVNAIFESPMGQYIAALIAAWVAANIFDITPESITDSIMSGDVDTIVNSVTSLF